MKTGDRLRFKSSVAGANFAFHGGDIVTVGDQVSEQEARNWLAANVAEPLDRGPERAESRANRR